MIANWNEPRVFQAGAAVFGLADWARADQGGRDDGAAQHPDEGPLREGLAAGVSERVKSLHAGEKGRGELAGLEEAVGWAARASAGRPSGERFVRRPGASGLNGQNGMQPGP